MKYRRVKLSDDPNNTAWSRSSTGYGQKIMRSQGWIPGSILGATDAPYVNGHPEATYSYLNTTRKDDKCGVGGSRHGAYDDGYCTGLDVFQGILGRLNGRTEDECDAGRIARRKLKTANYLESRWQVLKFVSGGLLEGDRSKEDRINANQDSDLSAGHQQDSPKPKSPSPPENEKAEDQVVSILADYRSHQKVLSETIDQESKRPKKRKRMVQSPANGEKQQRLLPEKGSPLPPVASDARGQASPMERTPLAGRHMVRGRYIRQKRMVMMDTKALNEVNEQLDGVRSKRKSLIDHSCGTDFNGQILALSSRHTRDQCHKLKPKGRSLAKIRDPLKHGQC